MIDGISRNMLKIAIGSGNPSKIKGAKSAFCKAFPKSKIKFRPFAVPSKIPQQPVGFSTTLKGAINRAKAAYKKWPCADYSIGLESGLIRLGGRFFDMQICAMQDREGTISLGCSMGFPLPKSVEEKLFAKKGNKKVAKCTLGELMDSLSGQKNIGRKKGAIFFLSKGLMERWEMSRQAVLCAFVERKSPVQ
jgi:inosine/xanthosine triphosphatase